MKYNRILLKISGEALLGNQQFGIAPEPVTMIANEIKKVVEMGAQVAVVVGGGNIFRGMKNSTKIGLDRATGDYVGMLATVMNAITLQSALTQINVDCRVQSAISMKQIAEPYIRHRAIRHLEKGRVVIFAAGTGNPFFTTDTASALRASEIPALPRPSRRESPYCTFSLSLLPFYYYCKIITKSFQGRLRDRKARGLSCRRV